MAYRVGWDNASKTVLLQRYLPGATKDDFYAVAQEAAQLLATVDHTVHLIIDEREIDLTCDPKDFTFVQRVTPVNVGKVMLIVDDRHLRYKQLLNDLGATLAPALFSNIEIVPSVDAARDSLYERERVPVQRKPTQPLYTSRLNFSNT